AGGGSGVGGRRGGDNGRVLLAWNRLDPVRCPAALARGSASLHALLTFCQRSRVRARRGSAAKASTAVPGVRRRSGASETPTACVSELWIVRFLRCPI